MPVGLPPATSTPSAATSADARTGISWPARQRPISPCQIPAVVARQIVVCPQAPTRSWLNAQLRLPLEHDGGGSQQHRGGAGGSAQGRTEYPRAVEDASVV